MDNSLSDALLPPDGLNLTHTINDLAYEMAERYGQDHYRTIPEFILKGSTTYDALLREFLSGRKDMISLLLMKKLEGLQNGT